MDIIVFTIHSAIAWTRFHLTTIIIRNLLDGILSFDWFHQDLLFFRMLDLCHCHTVWIHVFKSLMNFAKEFSAAQATRYLIHAEKYSRPQSGHETVWFWRYLMPFIEPVWAFWDISVAQWTRDTQVCTAYQYMSRLLHFDGDRGVLIYAFFGDTSVA